MRMVLTQEWPPLRVALFAFSITIIVTLIIGIIGFDDPWQKVVVLAIGYGLILSIGLYLSSTWLDLAANR